jgi:hypothetical protein
MVIHDGGVYGVKELSIQKLYEKYPQCNCIV